MKREKPLWVGEGEGEAFSQGIMTSPNLASFQGVSLTL